MFEEKGNSFISRMKGYKSQAIKGCSGENPCAEEIIPMIEAFFNKSMNVEVNGGEFSDVCGHIDSIAETVKYLAMNTRNYQKLTDEEVVFLQKIFDEIHSLYEQATECDTDTTYKNELTRKITCISQIICKNMIGMNDSKAEGENYRDGMIFKRYEDLWKIVHRVNVEWDELCSRGFALKVFYDYWESFKYERAKNHEMTEESKMRTFMKLLDGSMKFVQVYELRPVCFKAVDNDFEGEIVNRLENINSNPYGMVRKSE